MRAQNKVVATIVAATMALAAGACGGSDGDENGASKAAEDVKVAVMLKTFANEYWTAMRDGAQAKADELGVPVKIDAAASESATDEQVSKLEALKSGDYDCYAVAPITATNLIGPLISVSRAKTPVVSLDTPFDDADAKAAGLDLETYIASNHEQAGRLAAQQLAKTLGADASGARVAVIGGISGDATSNARLKGFGEGAKQAGMRVVQTGVADWDREKAVTLAGDMLRKHTGLTGIFAANDTMALGAAQAARNAGKDDVAVIGVDGSKNGLEAVKSGDMAATVAQYPYAVGAFGVEACVAAVKGESVPTDIEAPLTTVTKENVEAALRSYPKPFAPVEDPFDASGDQR